jgi:hypothetical protein
MTDVDLVDVNFGLILDEAAVAFPVNLHGSASDTSSMTPNLAQTAQQVNFSTEGSSTSA